MFATYVNFHGVGEKFIYNINHRENAEEIARREADWFECRHEHTKRVVRWGNSWYTPSGEFIAGFVEESD